MKTTAIHGPALGAGELHCALEEARERAALNSFCAATACSPAEVAPDGRHIELPRVFNLMRARGYEVADPVRAPLQPKRGFTGWLVHVRMPGAEFDIGFYTPEPASEPTAPKRARQPKPEHA